MNFKKIIPFLQEYLNETTKLESIAGVSFKFFENLCILSTDLFNFFCIKLIDYLFVANLIQSASSLNFYWLSLQFLNVYLKCIYFYSLIRNKKCFQLSSKSLKQNYT